jgi:hypothetical protein
MGYHLGTLVCLLAISLCVCVLITFYCAEFHSPTFQCLLVVCVMELNI